MKCDNCDKEIPDKSKFCPYCGTQIKKTEKKSNKYLILFFIILILIAGIILFKQGVIHF